MLRVKFAKTHKSAVIPSYAKPGDAGLDLTAVSMEYVRTNQTDYYEYDFGLSVEIPEGYFGLIVPRSSITKTDLFQSNSPGILDSGYRGPVSIRFRKLTGSPHTYSVGERVAQLVILQYPQIQTMEVDYTELSRTERGTGGFGSTNSK